MRITLWHNPRCSKSRAALALLQARGIQPDVVEYLATPPDADGIRAVLRRLGLPARALLRTGEAAYAELGLADEGLDEEALVQAMARHPILIERPVAIRDGQAVIGRPPERVLELLRD
jgi:arsenate reductase